MQIYKIFSCKVDVNTIQFTNLCEYFSRPTSTVQKQTPILRSISKSCPEDSHALTRLIFRIPSANNPYSFDYNPYSSRRALLGRQSRFRKGKSISRTREHGGSICTYARATFAFLENLFPLEFFFPSFFFRSTNGDEVAAYRMKPFRRVKWHHRCANQLGIRVYTGGMRNCAFESSTISKKKKKK